MVEIMSCRTGCDTQDHVSYGECLRAANLQIDKHALKSDMRLEKSKTHTLERYRHLRESGYQPPSIKKSNLDAFEASL